INEPDLKIARVSASSVEGDMAVLNFHYLVGKDGTVTHFTEEHRLAMFTEDEYKTAFREAGLDVVYDPIGVNNRGLYIGMKA
ncbi:MAG: SAM-dependent methyltransferase, partial [Anaerolineae bacterium]|nr:SAM-dependent methyltransferase [Anaerolineae bacterium]